MINKVTIEILSCHLCNEFKPRWWEYFSPVNFAMGSWWGCAGYCVKGNFYIPRAEFGNIPSTCPLIKREP